MPELVFRDATLSDVEPLVGLIESAYRGDDSRVGWTTEADLLAGQRTDPEGVRDVILAPGSRLLVAERSERIVSCCQLQKRDASALRAVAPSLGADGRASSPPDLARFAYVYFGMFSVSPGLQGGGVGKAVLAEAERIAREELGAGEMRMTVIRQREDLIAFYERRGFRRTGAFEPFPYGDERFGVPLRDDLEFAELVKPL
ncbi:ribosomal protein S18 acetylase RimI-like enzyme [Nocardioides albertanoniae]|uniref:Ribosomal protein S18 acetylase RimI-like enzyme n=1 Tax=Nocardioides albertanoniae TaxID=1175486 RepID=A0A543A386_9ACTN|nr:GNAT family N-acetyltransferase [Nocardioides albertanoniae]TQL67051.1 ribosomal protein S18 acetylase RimI-like enzyme [Nocardioides albertanoniae]